MRSLLIFFRLLAFGVIAVVVAFLLGREMLLLYSTVGLDNHINSLKILVSSPGLYAQSCKTKFHNYSDKESLSGFQLRFIDDTHYAVEAVCMFHDGDPILIKKGTLGPLVQRIPGYSGLFYGLDGKATALGVKTLGRTAMVGTEGATHLPPGSPDLASPATSCTGWGYSCCDTTQQISVGISAGDKALDCPGRCFQVCKSRPVVLSFRSDPAAPTLGSGITLTKDSEGKGEATFTFVVSDPDGMVKSVMLDYGDGKSESFVATEDAVPHTYTCPTSTGSCQFTASVTVTDNEGNTSVQAETSKIRVRM